MLQSPHPNRGRLLAEAKTLTILFTDLGGSTELLQHARYEG